MKHHRFLVDFPLITGKNGVLSDKEQIHQLEAVFRLKKGDEAIFFNENGDDYRVRFESFSKSEIGFLALEKRISIASPKRKVTLACAIIKRDNFEWVVEKATEIGVQKIIPLLTDNSVKLGFSLPRLKKIIKEAVEQCGRSSVPLIGEKEKFESVMGKEGDKYFFDGTGEKFFGDFLLQNEITIFIGPEGGWSEREKEFALRSKTNFATLGATTLRSETAATVASFAALNY